MHRDFRDNLVRIYSLMKAETHNLKADDLVEFFKDNQICNISEKEMENQLQYLNAKNYLAKSSGVNYEITSDGKCKINELKRAINRS